MIDAQDLHLVCSEPVRNDVRCTGYDQLPRQGRKPLDRGSDSLGNPPSGSRIVLGDVGLQRQQVVKGLAAPRDFARLPAGFRWRQFIIAAPAVEPRGHALVWDARLAPVRLLDRGTDALDLPVLDVEVLRQRFLGEFGPRSLRDSCQLVQRASRSGRTHRVSSVGRTMIVLQRRSFRRVWTQRSYDPSRAREGGSGLTPMLERDQGSIINRGAASSANTGRVG